MFGSHEKKGGDLPEEEWRFSEILEEDAKACLLYEMAREVEQPETYFSAFNSIEQAAFALEPMPLDPKERLDASSDFKQVRATMFTKPFDLKSGGSEDVGKEMLSGLFFTHPDGSLRGYPPILREKPWLALGDSWQGNLQLYAEHFLSGITFHAIAELHSWEERHPGITENLSSPGERQVLAININWNENDSALVDGFAMWLQRQRPKDFPSLPWTGRQSTVDSLNALSSLRLRHLYSIEDAIKYTKAVTGKPLYSDRSSWDRSQRRAISMFSKIFPGAGVPRSAGKISNRKC